MRHQCRRCGQPAARDATVVRGDGGAYVPLCAACVNRLYEPTCAVCGDTASTWTGSKDATLYVDERPGLDVCPACARMLESESREAREVLRP